MQRNAFGVVRIWQRIFGKDHLKRSKLIKIMVVDGKYWEKSDKELAIADKESKAIQILELLAEKKALEKATKDTSRVMCSMARTAGQGTKISKERLLTFTYD